MRASKTLSIKEDSYSLHSMEQNPSFSKFIFPQLVKYFQYLRSPEVHYGTHKSLSFFSTLNHVNIVHILPFHYFTIRFIIILPS